MTLTEDAARAMMILGTLVEDRGQLGLCVVKIRLDTEAGDRIV